MPRTRTTRMGTPNERRESLIQAALTLVGDVTLEGVDAVAVARRAGVSKALVYYYFPTHRDLQVEVVRAAADGLMRAMDAPIGATAGDRLASSLDAGIGYIEQYPQAYRAFSRGTAFSPQLSEVFEWARRTLVDRLAADLGLTEPTPAQRLCLRSWLALVEEAVLHWLASDTGVPRSSLVSYCCEVAFYIVATPLAAGPIAAHAR